MDRETRNAEDRYAVAVVVQVIILVESRYFQLEFMCITLPSCLSCFYHVYSRPTRVNFLAHTKKCMCT